MNINQNAVLASSIKNKQRLKKKLKLSRKKIDYDFIKSIKTSSKSPRLSWIYLSGDVSESWLGSTKSVSKINNFSSMFKKPKHESKLVWQDFNKTWICRQ